MAVKIFQVISTEDSAKNLEGVVFSNGSVVLSDGAKYVDLKSIVAWVKSQWPKYAVEVPQKEVLDAK